MGDVVVTHHRVEGQRDVLNVRIQIYFFVEGVGIKGIFVTIIISESRLFVVFLSILLLSSQDTVVEVDIVLSLRIGDVTQMGVQQVSPLNTDREHLVHAPRVVSHMAVGSHEERIFISI